MFGRAIRWWSGCSQRYRSGQQLACVWGNTLCVALSDDVSVAEKPKKQRAADKRENICPAEPMRDTIYTAIQEIKHLLEDEIGVGGLTFAVEVTQCESGEKRQRFTGTGTVEFPFRGLV